MCLCVVCIKTLKAILGLCNRLTASLQKWKTPTNYYSGYDIKPSDSEAQDMEYSFIASAPRSTVPRSGSFWLGPIYGSNRTNSVCKEITGLIGTLIKKYLKPF